MSLPLVRVPRLDLFRAFVAVGRRMSITLAAQDMCLSQPAISRQIKLLEHRLGTRLFDRGYREISFTPQGQQLFSMADQVLAGLQGVLGAAMGKPILDRRP